MEGKEPGSDHSIDTVAAPLERVASENVGNENKTSLKAIGRKPEIWSDEEIRRRMESVYQGWLSSSPKERGRFNTMYIQKTDRSLYHYIYKRGLPLEDFLPEAAQSHWKRMEKRVYEDSFIREKMVVIFDKWQRTSGQEAFDAEYIRGADQDLYGFIYERRNADFQQYLNTEAKQVWVEKHEFTEEEIKSQLEKLYLEWRKEASSRMFSESYIKDKNKVLYNYVTQSDRDFKDYLSIESSRVWRRQRRELSPENEVRERLANLYADWAEAGLSRRIVFRATYIKRVDPELYNYFLRNQLRYEDYLSGEALESWNSGKPTEKLTEAIIRSRLEALYNSWIDSASETRKDFDELYVRQKDIRLYHHFKVHKQDEYKPYLSPEALVHWKDNSEKKTLPRVDITTGIYTDTSQRSWVPPQYFSDRGNISRKTVEKILRAATIENIRGLNKKNRLTSLYSLSEAELAINEFLALPMADIKTGLYIDSEGVSWASRNYFVDAYGVNADSLQEFFNTDNVNRQEGRDKRGAKNILYQVKEAEASIQAHYREILQEREMKKAKEEVEIFTQEVDENKTLEAQIFRRLVSFFGASRAVDILYLYRPQYRSVPVEYVRSALSEYLGDFLIAKAEFRPEDIEEGIPYLSDPNLQVGLQGVIGESCLIHLNLSRRQTVGHTDREIVDYYIAYLRAEWERFDNPAVNQVLDRTAEYYRSVFEDFNPPDRIVPALQEGRDFPDTYQRINMKELAEKQRVLIADEMGGGKSASVILAKETLGLGPALVVAPSNVIATWQRYLSSEVDESGKQVGYFKPGQEPRVLVVEDPASLDGQDLSHYEYVLISQERLTRKYAEQLESCDWDMLIIDEVHKLKNIEKGKRAGVSVGLAEKVQGEGRHVALLSGTPVPNKVEDIAITLKLLYPERFKDTPNNQLVRQVLRGDLLDLRQLLVPRMQMKRLTETVDMPELEERFLDNLELSELEKEIYEVLLDEDELEAFDKLRILRQFLINPAMLDILPDMPGTKCRVAEHRLGQAFENYDKVVMFFNGYVQGVTRGENSVLAQMDLPDDVTVRIVDGETPVKVRRLIEQELKQSEGKVLVAVSGQTADVGVDYSGGEYVMTYNEPWSRYEARQELGRVYRPGLANNLTAETLIVKDTLEEGIHAYIEAKERAVEKLLRGIPISDLEREILEHGEEQAHANLEVNPQLAQYYMQSLKNLMRIFGHTKQLGEERFREFLTEHGQAYAQGYADLGSRSYQSNANRVAGTLITHMAQEAGQNPEDVVILDTASGPEMLRSHMAEDYQNRVMSVDLNAEHFKDSESGKAAVGSLTSLPIGDKMIDYTNLTFALHYTDFRPSQGNYERLQVLTELNRVLKEGGRAVLNMVHTLDFKDEEKFEEVVEVLGFHKVSELSGEVEEGDNYRSKVIVLEKQADVDMEFNELVELLSDDWDGLKFRTNKRRLGDSKRIIGKFHLNGQNMAVNFNQHDRTVMEEETQLIGEGEGLKQQYGGVETIPPEEVINREYIRFYNGKRYVLFKRLTTDKGYVLVK